MRPIRQTLVATAAALLAMAFPPAVVAAAFTYETPAELATSLDSEGDGVPDALLVDKESGVQRLGLQHADGSVTWVTPQFTGMDRIAALTAGRFASNSVREGYAVASPDWNQALWRTRVDQEPARLPDVGLGPSLVAAVALEGGASPDDLVVATEWDDPPFPASLQAFSVAVGGPASLGDSSQQSAPLRQGNRARFRKDLPWLLGALQDLPAGRTLVTQSYSPGTGLASGAGLGGLLPDASWAWGEFSAAGLSRFLIYSPSDTALWVPGVFVDPILGPSFTAGARYDLGQGIGQLQVIPDASGAYLLVVFAGGNAGATYDFDGNHAPVLRQTLTPPAGSKLSMALPLGSGNFLLLHGADGGAGRSTGWQRWAAAGSKHTLSGSGALPSIPSGISTPNVVLWETDPRLVPSATPLRLLKAGEWSDGAILAGAQLSVTQETFQGSTSGLGGMSVVAVNGLVGLPASTFAAVNQRAPTESTVFLGPVSAAVTAEVAFSPPAGVYHLGVAGGLELTLSTSLPGALRYRVGLSTPWMDYDPDHPPALTASAVVQAFVSGAPAHPIYSARYVIVPAPPVVPAAGVDANHNGLPDDWEAVFGLSDPSGDADGDGATNLEEYQAGTDPLDPGSKPSGNPAVVVVSVREPRSGAPAGTLCEVAWPAAVSGATLETTASLDAPATWVTVGGPFTLVGPEQVYYQPLATAAAHRFFRLRYSR